MDKVTKSSQPTNFMLANEISKRWDEIVLPLIKNENFNVVLDLGCDSGSNSKKLVQLTKRKIYLVSLNAYLMDSCIQSLEGYKNCEKEFIANSGDSLKALPDASITFIHSFNAIVHSDSDAIENYIRESARVLKEGGSGCIHHSNYGNVATNDLGAHNRSNMTKELFAEFCKKYGLVCYYQTVDWGSVPKSDCISLFRKQH
jgi:ubiquinone/menaquinone biosynthesis C-methylase UbiE